jgi:hypothetical protein
MINRELAARTQPRPVELFRGLHKGKMPAMIVIDTRDIRDMARNIVRSEAAGKTIRSCFLCIINEAT